MTPNPLSAVRHQKSAFTLLLAAVLLAGCGPSYPPTAEVFGRVTYAGKPLASDPAAMCECEIRFTPANGRPARSVLDARGNYRLTSFRPGDGAMPGKYTVTIKAVRVHLPAGGTEGQGGWLEWLAPQRYDQTTTSGLTCTVEAGKNELNFDLPAE